MTAQETLTLTPGRPAVSVAEIFPFIAARTPDKIALITAERSFTYRELDDLSDRTAAGLRARGLNTGDVVSLFSQNSWRWIVAYHGILKAGGVVNPINVMLTGPELRFVLTDCQAVGLFVGAAETERVRASVDEVDLLFDIELGDDFDAFVNASEPNPSGSGDDPQEARRPRDLGSIGYTSGTTGHPKGAMQSLESVLLNCAYTATMHGKVDSDVILTALPAAHVYGNVAINGTFLTGGTVVLMERFDPAAALAAFGAHGVTMFEGVPAMYSMMLAHSGLSDADFSRIRVCSVGGQTFSPIVIEKWEALTGAPLLDLWGMTELSGLGTTHSVNAPAAPGSIGVSLPGTDLAIAPIDGGPGTVPLGEPGELVVRGPLVMLGYFGQPGATAETIDEDGWLHTGDVARLEPSGHVYIVDRLKDVIITGGYNVYPAEIERVIATHPDVAMVAVGREPDETKGEIAVAHVVAREGASVTAEQIIEFSSAELAAYKRPRKVVFTDSLPTTSSGKIMRRKLGEAGTATS